ncbi:malonyl-coenzyme A:anthocyanin 3-O-glucoside-6''-O-malonyltransferase-like [Cynara cardunculus var. scolymus]|uniref:Chloramphenicol acetyltransferase-like domain-containing protein n=1 Tax=Cynara cardunculus var. scolymus TaxID=59895 RepID=A0A103Y803_CYNCS|nr:malonyl-coenzyme A:anthocyanin 3-O-glucoside-6''-O-malonyltransferase-like [Cynara cardunculus var. scolymus]KVI04208.1 Chloramphenicol acetyltransferase-like domain-containing protein [Cynara cardunculus var. scolymus]
MSHEMTNSLPILSVLEHSQVSPPPATVGDNSLPLTFFDIYWLNSPPVHHLFFYDLPLTKARFTEIIVPNLKRSLSITLQHFFPFAGNLIIFPTPTRKPEIRYGEGDSIAVTVAECNLDFDDLTGNHPRDCDKFYHLIPSLGPAVKVSDYVSIPVFSIQVTLFPNHGISIGMTNLHALGDATTRFGFLKAWTKIARSGTDESFLANGTLPLYDRVVQNQKLDESYLKRVNVEAFNEEYRPQNLSGPTDKVRATLVLTRTTINRMKKRVSTNLPTLEYVSSFTVACGYIWSCIAKSRNDELELFGFAVDCRARMDPPIPAAYFGNCVGGCAVMAKRTLLTGKDGFVTAAKLLGENLHELLTHKDGIVKDIFAMIDDLLSNGMPTTTMGVAGTPKLKFYDIDFGWGKPKKHETISIDYNNSISLSTCKESKEDLEIGVCLSAMEMEAFVHIFHEGLEAYL